MYGKIQGLSYLVSHYSENSHLSQPLPFLSAYQIWVILSSTFLKTIALFLKNFADPLVTRTIERERQKDSNPQAY